MDNAYLQFNLPFFKIRLTGWTATLTLIAMMCGAAFIFMKITILLWRIS
jgi:hypothetical protein